MGYDEEMVAFLHDAPSDGMAITIFGETSFQDLFHDECLRVSGTLSPEFPRRKP